MDILGILQTLKGKVLDATHFEDLKHAYELQDQNLKQLKNNIDALKESNELLKDKLTKLEQDVSKLRDTITALEKDVPASLSLAEYVPSRVAAAILEQCVKHDVNEFLAEDMFSRISLSRIEANAGIDELRKHKIIDLAAVGTRGARYFLTAEGRTFVLQRGKE